MTAHRTTVQPPGTLPALLRFLGSMNLAIMLLVIIAVASVAGTVLKQNEPYQNYLIKFGPYWHELYRSLGLYDVYSSGWFILILTFLVVSTSVCVIRHIPGIVKSLRRYREDIQERSLRNLPDHATWQCAHAADRLSSQLIRYLHKTGYRTRTSTSEEKITIAAVRGWSNRAGYILTHVAIVIICVGGLVDGNLPLKLKILSGQLQVESNDSNISSLPPQSRLPENNPSFRAGVSIPEGARVNYAFINTGGGFILQELPFSVQVKDFRIEHYQSGQPKSFESDLVIHDPRTNYSEEHTIAVNHPLYYKGYTLYQSSFGDGGTRLKLSVHPLQIGTVNAEKLEGTVGNNLSFKTATDELQIEFMDFRKFNIFPDANVKKPDSFIDHGPNFTFRLRQPDGTAREYINYQHPVPLEGNYYFLSGMRAAAADEFQYLYIPVDATFSTDRFFRLLELLHDDAKLEPITRQAAELGLQQVNSVEPALQDNMQQAMLSLLGLFRSGGFDAVTAYAEQQVPADGLSAAIQAYFKLLHGALLEIYRETLRKEDAGFSELDDAELLYFEDAVNALNAIHHYGAPFYLQLDDYDEQLATGLQITRTPGKYIVYAGFAMLISGVFLLFYVAYQRLWIMLIPQATTTAIIMAGIRSRHRRQFSSEFRALAERFRTASGGR